MSKQVYRYHYIDDDADYYMSKINCHKIYDQVDQFFNIIIKIIYLLFIGINLLFQILFNVMVIIVLNCKSLINLLIQVVCFLSLVFMTIVTK